MESGDFLDLIAVIAIIVASGVLLGAYRVMEKVS